MFYLTTHSTHFIYGYLASDVVKDRSDSEIGNPLPPNGLLFPISRQSFFYMHHPTDRIIHTTVFLTPVVYHWLGPPRRIDPTTHRTMSERSYHGAICHSFEINSDGV